MWVDTNKSLITVLLQLLVDGMTIKAPTGQQTQPRAIQYIKLSTLPDRFDF